MFVWKDNDKWQTKDIAYVWKKWKYQNAEKLYNYHLPSLTRIIGNQVPKTGKTGCSWIIWSARKQSFCLTQQLESQSFIMHNSPILQSMSLSFSTNGKIMNESISLVFDAQEW